MYVQKITFQVLIKESRDQMVDECNWLLSTYRKNGQIQGGLNTVYVAGSAICAVVYCLEAKSLDPVYNSPLVNEQLKKVQKMCASDIHFEVLGTEFVAENPACSCKKPKNYLLNSLFLSRESPLICSDCHQSVPLYKLPLFESGDYTPILCWFLSNQCLDGIETNNLNNDTFPDMPRNIIRALDKEAGAICRHIYKKTGIKVFKLTAETKRQKGKVDHDELETADQ